MAISPDVTIHKVGIDGVAVLVADVKTSCRVRREVMDNHISDGEKLFKGNLAFANAQIDGYAFFAAAIRDESASRSAPHHGASRIAGDRLYLDDFSP